ncbi:hypothetical protein AMTRI_Chr07g77330 [Amborella trichopoda]
MCQIHSSLIHQPSEPLHTIVTSWSFPQWGMDIVGPIDPPSVVGHAFILVATDYFSKWVEAVPLKQVPGTAVVNFVRHHIIYRFEVPDRIISDNGPQFRSQHMDRLVYQFGFQWKYSTMYYP